MRLPYRIVRPLARIALKIYFKKIFLTGIDNLPTDQPIILAANHPTAFLEPCLLACVLPSPLHFMVRGDFFQKPLFRKMLESLHMIPMYRLKDIGIKGVRNNFSSFDIVYDLLAANKTILILAEGTTVHEKRLRPIKKGTARLALGAMEKHPSLRVQIVPIGVNYTDVIRFRSTVMLDIGPPMNVANYLQNANQHPAKTINQLTKDLKIQLEQQVINIIHKEEEEFINQALIIQRNQHNYPSLPVQLADRKPLAKEIQLATKLTNYPTIKKEALKESITAYFQQLYQLDITDFTVKANKTNDLKDYFIFALGFIPYVLGYLFNFLPLYFGKWWSNKAPEIEFVAPIKASFSLAAYLVYLPILLLIGWVVNQIWVWIVIAAIPILGFLALHFRDFKIKFQERRRWSKLPESQRNLLLKQRNKILSQL